MSLSVVLRTNGTGATLFSKHFLKKLTLEGSKRFETRVNYRQSCTPKLSGPRCTKENLEKTPCAARKREERENPPTFEQLTIRSMWANPECCSDPCPEAMPRFDELYYHTTDKTIIKYPRTWKECPDMRVVRKPLCCFEKLDLPEIKRRDHRSTRPRTADCQGDSRLMQCIAKKEGDCPSFQLEGCRPVRNPPKCMPPGRKPKICGKFCAPHPAFSECQHDPLFIPPRVECFCLHGPMMCEVQRYARKLQARKK